LLLKSRRYCAKRASQRWIGWAMMFSGLTGLVAKFTAENAMLQPEL
jgi:hypothetical protein